MVVWPEYCLWKGRGDAGCLREVSQTPAPHKSLRSAWAILGLLTAFFTQTHLDTPTFGHYLYHSVTIMASRPSLPPLSAALRSRVYGLGCPASMSAADLVRYLKTTAQQHGKLPDIHEVPPGAEQRLYAGARAAFKDLVREAGGGPGPSAFWSAVLAGSVSAPTLCAALDALVL